MFSDAEKVHLRRFCGYPVFGNTATQHTGYRYLTHDGALEYRLLNLSDHEEQLVRETWLPRLVQLETDLFDRTRENLDTDEAAVWKHNKAEHRDRAALFDDLRRQLCGYLGIPPGPHLGHGGLKIVV